MTMLVRGFVIAGIVSVLLLPFACTPARADQAVTGPGSLPSATATLSDKVMFVTGTGDAARVKTDTFTAIQTLLGAGLTTGSVTSTHILDATIVNADIASNAAIALSKLATDPLARANHTGTQPMSTISDAGALATLSAVSSATITDATIVNADISASAAIALSKLATDPLARANHTGTQAWSTISTPAGSTTGAGAGGAGFLLDGMGGTAVDFDGGAAFAISGNGGAGSDLSTGGAAFTITGLGGAADGASAGANAGTINVSAIGAFGGGSLFMSSNGFNSAGSIDTTAGGSLTTGTGNINTGNANGTLGSAAFVAASDTAYDATSWNANTDVPTKNAIRDKLETMTGTGSVTSVAMTVPSFLAVTGSPVTTSGTLAVSLSGTALPELNGGTGATSLANLITLGTHTTGNYVATIADSGASEVTVANSGTESAAVTLALAAGITRDAEWDSLAKINAATTDADALATNGSGAALTGIPTSIAGTTNQITASAATGAVTLSLPATITGLTSVTSTGFTGALTGNASTATALATARTIGGTSFDGTGNIVPATITVADTTDATAFVALFDSATGDLAPKTDGGLTYDATTGTLGATTFVGAGGGLTLDASGFNGNLATTDNTLQEVAQKVDDLSVGGGGSGGNWVLVSTTTISGTPATLDFALSGGYARYRLGLDNVVCSADGYILFVRTSTDGGSTFDSGASDYNYSFGPVGAYSPTQGTAAEISTGAAIGSGSDEGWSGEIIINDPSSTAKKAFVEWSLYGAAYSASSVNRYLGAARRDSTGDVTHLRLLFQSANTFASGAVKLYRWSE